MSRLLTAQEIKKFSKIIDSYKPNNAVLEQFKNSNFGVIAGPAGAGKDTLRDELIKRFPATYVPILSTTTRPPRVGEVDDKTYHFWEVEAVENGLKEREFFQAALVHNQQVSCLHIDEVRKLKNGQWGLSILIPYTEIELRKIKSNIKTIFLIAPSAKDLVDRIKSERLLDDSEVKRRLEAAKRELQQAQNSKHYYCCVTDTVDNAVNTAHNYFKNGLVDAAVDLKAREVIKNIMLELTNE